MIDDDAPHSSGPDPACGSDPDTDTAEGGTCFADLPKELCVALFTLLQPQELLRSAACCKAWRDLAYAEAIWEALAHASWPANLLDITEYKTFKTLVLDKNRRNTVESVPLNTACTWRQGSAFNSCFYRCKLLSMELTANAEFSLAFDARGELDLRLPATSTLAVVTLHPGVRGGPGQPIDGVEVPDDPDFISATFEAVHLALRPTSYMFCAGQPGHYKGILRWPSQQLLAALDAPNRSLAFCYACDLGSSGVLSYQRGWPDYTTAVLLTVPPQSRFADVWQGKRVIRGKREQEESLQQETLECEERRWADRPPWVAQRADWWPQHRPITHEWKKALGHQMAAEGGLEWILGWGNNDEADLSDSDDPSFEDDD